ncbi:RNA-metabolising metallo-beta-lactamase [Staphylococcus simiae]|nr:RNA-metabolising metallo-beta-lactamase [Staphylococcus simiae]
MRISLLFFFIKLKILPPKFVARPYINSPFIISENTHDVHYYSL